MGWIVTIVVGGIVGWLASLLMKTDKQMGIVANVLVGIVGSSLGFWLAAVAGLAAYGVIAQWAVAVAGAALLIYVLKALGVFK
ncbi:MAG TPA: GlsB/YeaQ/YmgE family stress response membrane protein [Vicinamibacteria bacterium]|nr:GlsB/YeaQ/YmgE family stress response membrane protein [Vicinamibacteria bacterium]